MNILPGAGRKWKVPPRKPEYECVMIPTPSPTTRELVESIDRITNAVFSCPEDQKFLMPKELPMNPKPIRTLEELEQAAIEKRAVIQPGALSGPLRRPMPAAWLFQWQGQRILEAFRRGIVLYERPK